MIKVGDEKIVTTYLGHQSKNNKFINYQIYYYELSNYHI